MKKTIYILLPLIIFRVSHDIIQLLLYFIVNLVVGFGEQTAALLQENGAYVTSGVQILDMLLAMAVTWGVERYCRTHATFSELQQGVLWKEVLLGSAAYENKSGEDRTAENESSNNESRDNESSKKELSENEPGEKGSGMWAKRRPTLHYGTYVVKCTLVFAGLAVFLNCLLLQTRVNRFSAVFDATAQRQSGTPVIMAILLFGIVSPLVEEYVFRYLLYGHMKCYFSAALSVGISALFFGIYHANLVQGLYGFFMGLYLAYSYECTLIAGVDEKKGMLVPVTCHGIANLLVYFGGRRGLFMIMPLWVATLLLLVGIVIEVLYYKKNY